MNSFSIFEYLPLHWNFMPILQTLSNMLKFDCLLGIEILIVNKLLKRTIEMPQCAHTFQVNCCLKVHNAHLNFTLT